jgi:hypothetical protein
MQNESKTSKSRFRADAFGSFGFAVIALCLALAVAMGFWHFHNRRWLGPTFNVDVDFVAAPKAAVPGQAARFVAHVEEDNKNTPLAGRVVAIAVSPPDKAQILSVSGASGTNYAKDASLAKGRTDSAGNISVMVKPADAGKFTLVATDSASEKEGTVNFFAVPPKG